MSRSLLVIVLATLLVLPARAFSRQMADEDVTEVVVTATRLETPVDEVSGTLLVITAEDIREKQARTVSEALRGLPGIDLVNQGGAGKSSSVLLRGGDTRFTLVLVDGVEVNDPSNPERTFDFAHLSTDDIERIEVLFGPQSTLYGSDAIGGVVQIITKKGEGRPGIEVGIETGAFETLRTDASVRGKSGPVSWSLYGDFVDTEGISAASEADGNTERDGYERQSTAGSVELDLGGSGSVRIDARWLDAMNELDHYGGPGGDDPNFTGDAEQVVFSGRLTVYPLDMWEASMAVSRNIHERHDLNRPDPDRPFTMELNFKGVSEKVEFVNNLYVGDRSIITLGVDSERETGESSFFSDEFGPYSSAVPEESALISGIFLQDQYTAPSGITVTLGARTDDHSDFGNETTWRTGVSIPLSEALRLRGVYGTGFRAPSIDQLFNPDYGNPDLEAERSRGWDAGLEASVGRNVTATLAWYFTEYDNLIAWFDADGDPSTWWDGSYQNISRARTEGVDLEMEARTGSVTLGASGSLLRTRDDQGEELLRRPRTRWGARVGYGPSERLTMNLDTTWVGEREDWGDVTLDDYTLLNLAVSYRVSDALKVNGRVENLLDEEYEEAGGYGTPGRAAYLGLRAEL